MSFVVDVFVMGNTARVTRLVQLRGS